MSLEASSFAPAGMFFSSFLSLIGRGCKMGRDEYVCQASRLIIKDAFHHSPKNLKKIELILL